MCKSLQHERAPIETFYPAACMHAGEIRSLFLKNTKHLFQSILNYYVDMAVLTAALEIVQSLKILRRQDAVDLPFRPLPFPAWPAVTPTTA